MPRLSDRHACAPQLPTRRGTARAPSPHLLGPQLATCSRLARAAARPDPCLSAERLQSTPCLSAAGSGASAPRTITTITPARALAGSARRPTTLEVRHVPHLPDLKACICWTRRPACCGPDGARHAPSRSVADGLGPGFGAQSSSGFGGNATPQQNAGGGLFGSGGTYIHLGATRWRGCLCCTVNRNGIAAGCKCQVSTASCFQQPWRSSSPLLHRNADAIARIWLWGGRLCFWSRKAVRQHAGLVWRRTLRKHHFHRGRFHLWRLRWRQQQYQLCLRYSDPKQQLVWWSRKQAGHRLRRW